MKKPFPETASFFIVNMRYIHYFNPVTMAVLQGQPSHTAPSNVHKMMKELELYRYGMQTARISC